MDAQEKLDVKERPKLFISHCHDDIPKSKGKNWMESLQPIIERNYECICSSIVGRDTPPGKDIYDFINDKLEKCSFAVCFISENYLRSSYCLYELALCHYLLKKKKKKKKKETEEKIGRNNKEENKEKNKEEEEEKRIICIVQSSIASVFSERVPFVNPTIRRIDLDKVVKKNASSSFMQALGMPNEEADAIIISKSFKAFNRVSHSNRAYVGMLDSYYKNCLDYLQKNGISHVQLEHLLDRSEMRVKVKNADRIYIVSTTGAPLYRLLKEEIIPICIKKKITVHCLMPEKGTDVIRDLALAEERGGEKRSNPVVDALNTKRINDECDAVNLYLNEGVLAAKGEGVSGIVKVYNCKTLLRQTLLLVVGKHGSVWGWVTMTLPPFRSADSLSLKISDGKANRGLSRQLIDHCECIMKLAEENGEVTIIDGDTLLHPHESIQDYWRLKKEKASLYMHEQSERFEGVLIEVAAQHPLDDEGRPGTEFERRLRFAMEIGKSIRNAPVHYYVPGSLHNGDTLSLSDAGRNFLIENGIPNSDIFGDEKNAEYKEEDGVYNSADECFVSSEIFKAGDYGRLICVCSPYQTMRKTFHYLEFGVLPECYGIAAPSLFHDVVSEYFGSLDHVVYRDHSWQDVNSAAFLETRKKRSPDFTGE